MKPKIEVYGAVNKTTGELYIKRSGGGLRTGWSTAGGVRSSLSLSNQSNIYKVVRFTDYVVVG